MNRKNKMQDLSVDETNILESIFLAINGNNKISVWDSLALRLDELSFTIRAKSNVQVFDSKIKRRYNKCKHKLHLSMLYDDEKRGRAAENKSKKLLKKSEISF